MDMTGHVQFEEGIPENIPCLVPPACRPGILISDDAMGHCSDDERILDLFTKVSHYCDVTCLYLTQNLFPPEKFSRSISLNTQYIIAFNNPHHTLGLQTLAQQAFARQVPFVWESFQDATSHPFGYLMLDLHPPTQKIQRVRTKILLTEHHFPIVYVNKETHKTDQLLLVLLS